MQIAIVSGYKILHFGVNPQKYQTLVPTKNSHLKVTSDILLVTIIINFIPVGIPRDGRGDLSEILPLLFPSCITVERVL